MPRKKVNIAIRKLKQQTDKILSDLGSGCTFNEFSEEYKKQFPEEYLKYVKKYSEISKQQKSTKGTPPAPEQYLKNAFNNAVVRNKKT